MIVAIASTDGETVNEHFGKTDRFFIYDIEGKQQHLLMIREVTPFSTGDQKHTFDQDRMRDTLAALKGCQKVYCQKIGERPRTELAAVAIEAVTGTMKINEIEV